MKKIILTLTLGSLLLNSCVNSSKENLNSGKEVSDNNNELIHGGDQQIIQLNNGEKWLVNEEMKPFINDAENILHDYVKSNSTDYKTLAKQLEDKNSGLIKSCTMKGESHDELHNWLHPHIGLIKSLSETTSAEDATLLVSKLEASFKTYHDYFH